MKKLTALFLTIVLLCSLTGCDRQSLVRRPDEDSSSSAARPKPPHMPGVWDAQEDEPEEPEDTGDAEEAGDTAEMEALLGFWEGDVYSNAALGLSFTLPEGWGYASDEELLKMIDEAASNELLSDRGRMLSELNKGRFFYAMAAGGQGNDHVSIGFDLLNNVIGRDMRDEENYAAVTVGQQETHLDESSGLTLNFGDTYRAQLGGKEFLVLPLVMTMSGVEVDQWIYLRRVDDRMAVIMITAFAGVDVETMAGGVSAFAPYAGDGYGGSGASGASGGTGTSGLLTATGDIGRTFSTMFFDYTVLSVETPAQYHGYTPEDGNKLLVVRVRVKNDYGSTLPMYDTDFPLFWGDDDYEYAWAVDAFTDDMMPLEWELADGKEAEWDMLFEVPADKMDFSLSYQEEYVDRFGRDRTGDWYDAYFTLLTSSAA